MSAIRSFQIVNRNCNNRKEVYVSCLSQLIQDAREKLDLVGDMKVVLESDGTIVDNEEYFATLEQNTCLMILKSDESWNIPAKHLDINDEVDFYRSDVNRLLKRLKGDTTQIVMLCDKDLELLTEVNPEEMGDFHDKNFLRDVQEACNLYLNDRRDAKDCVQLMKMYHEATHYS